ncbi:hypothetical protein GG344DRAFT_67928 [Lentinula edodes]|nr:hypothetical protein GG344DRAFT_67928 [Lentinula edodes]
MGLMLVSVAECSASPCNRRMPRKFIGIYGVNDCGGYSMCSKRVTQFIRSLPSHSKLAGGEFGRRDDRLDWIECGFYVVKRALRAIEGPTGECIQAQVTDSSKSSESANCGRLVGLDIGSTTQSATYAKVNASISVDPLRGLYESYIILVDYQRFLFKFLPSVNSFCDVWCDGVLSFPDQCFLPASAVLRASVQVFTTFS